MSLKHHHTLKTYRGLSMYPYLVDKVKVVGADVKVVRVCTSCGDRFYVI